LLEAYRFADLYAPSKAIESIPLDDRLHLLHASGQFMRLAWAIRGLCGRGALEHVDASFIRDELLGAGRTRPASLIRRESAPCE